MNIRQNAFTLIEMLVVVSIMIIFSALAIPAFNNITQSNKTGQALSLIKSYMALAQAHAAQTQKYAGVRFQRDLWGDMHLVLVENNHLTITNAASWGPSGTWDNYNLTYRYTAVPNTKPARLPDNVKVLPYERVINDSDQLIDDAELDGNNNFSILFSPTGQLVQKQCLCLPRLPLGTTRTDYATYVTPLPYDDRVFAFSTWGTQSEKGPPFVSDNIIFNTLAFPNSVQSSYASFIVYDADIVKKATHADRYQYLTSTLQPSIVNTFTGSVLQLDDIR